ncbi:hypothetical protein NPIL_685331, partial [Nephila pilipes]
NGSGSWFGCVSWQRNGLRCLSGGQERKKATFLLRFQALSARLETRGENGRDIKEKVKALTGVKVPDLSPGGNQRSVNLVEIFLPHKPIRKKGVGGIDNEMGADFKRDIRSVGTPIRLPTSGVES